MALAGRAVCPFRVPQNHPQAGSVSAEQQGGRYLYFSGAQYLDSDLQCAGHEVGDGQFKGRSQRSPRQNRRKWAMDRY